MVSNRVGQCHKLHHRRIWYFRRFNCLHDGEIIPDLYHHFRAVQQWRVHTWEHAHTLTYTHKHIRTHTPTNAIGRNTMHCISLKTGCGLTPLDISWRKVVHLHARHPLKSWRLDSSVRLTSAAAVLISLKARVHYALTNVFNYNLWLWKWR